MPRIIVTANSSEDSEKIIDDIEKISRSVFGENGILPLPPQSVEIIPNFRNHKKWGMVFPTILILLYDLEERTPELLKKIEIQFRFLGNRYFAVVANAQSKNLWRKF